MSKLILPDHLKSIEEEKPSVPEVPQEAIDLLTKGHTEVSEVIGTELPPIVERKLDGTSRILPEELEEAKAYINEQMGFDAPTMAGYYMAVKIYIRPSEMMPFRTESGEVKALYMPEEYRAQDKYRSCVALVVAQGPECYKGPRFQESWLRRNLRKVFNRFMDPVSKYPWCKVGDWIVIPRNEGTQLNYKGIPMQFLPDDRVLAIVDDPTDITRD